jgi:hypothetical protein
VGFVVDKVALGRVFSEYFGFNCQSSFHQILHHHNHPGQATIGQSVTAVPSGPSWTPPNTKRIKKKYQHYSLQRYSVSSDVPGTFHEFLYTVRFGRVCVPYKTDFGLNDWIHCTLYIHTLGNADNIALSPI